MAVQAIQYDICKKYRHDGTLNLLSNTFNLALLASTYVPNASTHVIFSDVSAHEIAAGGNYTAGGKALTGNSVNNIRFLADDLIFAALTATFRYGVLYAPATLNGIVAPLLGYVLFDNTPADVVITAENFNVLWDPSGIITF